MISDGDRRPTGNSSVTYGRILVGIVAVLGIVTLQQEFWLGPGWVVGWGNVPRAHRDRFGR